MKFAYLVIVEQQSKTHTKKKKQKSTRQEEREEAEYCSDFGSFWVFNNCCPSFLLEKYKSNTTCIIQGLLFVGPNLGK